MAPKLDAPLLFAAPALAGFGSLTLTVFWLLNMVVGVAVVVDVIAVALLPQTFKGVGLKVLRLFGLGDKALDCGVIIGYGDGNFLVRHAFASGSGDGLDNGSLVVANSNGDGGGNEIFCGFEG